MKVEDVLEVVSLFNSAPSALIFVRLFSDDPTTEDEESEIYERDDELNNAETERVLMMLSPEQMADLVTCIRDTLEEYKKQYGPEYTRFLNGVDIDSMLSQ